MVWAGSPLKTHKMIATKVYQDFALEQIAEMRKILNNMEAEIKKPDAAQPYIIKCSNLFSKFLSQK